LEYYFELDVLHACASNSFTISNKQSDVTLTLLADAVSANFGKATFSGYVLDTDYTMSVAGCEHVISLQVYNNATKTWDTYSGANTVGVPV